MQRKLYTLAASAMCLLCATAPNAIAQATQEDEATLSKILDAFFSPNWQVFAHSGATTSGRYLLQDVPGGQRALGTDVGWNLGLGGGVDFLPHVGFRGSYTYAKTDLKFRTDNGDGSDVLDLSDVGTLKSGVLSLELMRYMLPHRAFFTPYGSIGFVGAWWGLDETAEVFAPGGSTQFRWGGTGSLGGQFRFSDHWLARLEWDHSGIQNPFAGGHSFATANGLTIDEPSRVGKTDWRVVAVYDFSSPEEKPRATTARRSNGRGTTRSRP